jgi:hypothetical protein
MTRGPPGIAQRKQLLDSVSGIGADTAKGATCCADLPVEVVKQLDRFRRDFGHRSFVLHGDVPEREEGFGQAIGQVDGERFDVC